MLCLSQFNLADLIMLTKVRRNKPKYIAIKTSLIQEIYTLCYVKFTIVTDMWNVTVVFSHELAQPVYAKTVPQALILSFTRRLREGLCQIWL
jgi:lysine/ornithine N-monooxygenase